MWGQFFIVDHGETLGKNISLFRQTFFKPKINKWIGYIDWIPNEKRKADFSRIVKNKTIYYAKEECQDLPDRVIIPTYLTLDDEAKAYYDAVKDQLISSIIDNDDTGWLTKIKNPFVKMRQVCSGYVRVKNEDETEEELSFSNPKEAMLEQLVSNLPDDCKMIIFYDFTPSGERIVAKLNELKIGHEWLWGGTKDKLETIRRFKTFKKCRILVCNLRSGSIGLNLQEASYAVFYELPLSGIVKAQADSRIWRTGQDKTVYIYDFIVKNTVEEKIMKFLEEGEMLFHQIVEGKIELDKVAKPVTFLQSFIKSELKDIL